LTWASACPAFHELTTLVVESPERAPRVVRELSALVVSSATGRIATMRSRASGGASVTFRGCAEKAIDQLVDASERLLKITSVDVSAQRVYVDRLLQERSTLVIAQPR